MSRPFRTALSGTVAVALLAAGSLAASIPARAQAWPARPVHFILSQPPGTGPDILARIFGDKLTRRWGQQVVVENRPGGNNIIGAQAAARAAPDGYTLFFATTAATVINLFTVKSLPYDPAKDFVPVALLAKSPFILVVNTDVPARSVAELVTLARKQPGKLSFASDNARGLAGMLGEMLNVEAGINVVHVPYQGSVQALQETVAGRTQYTFNSAPPVAPFVKSGKLRPLAVTGPERMPGMENVPTMSDTFPGFEYFGWYMIYAPTGTPTGITQRVNRDFGELMKDPDIVAKLASFGSVVEKSPGTPKSLHEFLRQEEQRWGKAVKAAKIQPQ
jgi:tripartite-type tricarboxylate transporter receptor subunit TctC